jgi:hypothetical protein
VAQENSTQCNEASDEPSLELSNTLKDIGASIVLKALLVYFREEGFMGRIT